jgi:hypothetical protein
MSLTTVPPVSVNFYGVRQEIEQHLFKLLSIEPDGHALLVEW